MPIVFACQCGKRLAVVDAQAGRMVRCADCGRTLQVPSASQKGPAHYDISGGDESSPSPRIEHDALSSMMVNRSTIASNSAGVRINYLHYLICHPTNLIIAFVMIVGGGIGAILVGHPAILIFAGAGLFFLVQGLLSARAKFVGGDVCPAVVVSERPYRIAVSTDFSTGRGNNRPVVLIRRASLARMTGGPPQVGQRLATVALYYGVASEDAWRNFDPTVLACASRNQNDIARVTASISAFEWRQLDTLLNRLPDRKDGLYKLWLGTQNTYVSGLKKHALMALVLVALSVPVIAVVANAAKRSKVPTANSSAQSSRPAIPKAPRRNPVPERASGQKLAVKSPVISSPPAVPAEAPPPAASAAVSAATPIQTAQPTPSAPPNQLSSTAKPTAIAGVPTTTASPSPQPAAYKLKQTLEIKEKSGKWSVGNILKVEAGRYFVHYEGWSDSWDEWVTPDRLRPIAATAVAATSRASGGVFKTGQKVDIYEKRTHWSPGVILKAEGSRYFVHYDGWSDSWNEWVEAAQLRPRSDK